MKLEIGRIDWARLFLAVIICQLAGAIGSIFTLSSIGTWYAALNKPSFVPPNWVFGPAWITLYALMGVSLYLVWQKGLEKKGVKTALLAFGAQLVLNTLWSIIFFGLRLPSVAFLEIVLLLIAIAATIFLFRRISGTAALLLIPYFLWTSFASVLNFFVWMLNL